MTDENAQPTEQPTQPQEIDQDKISVLMETLERAGITNADDPAKALQGKFDASRQAGNLANQLGNARTEIQQLTQALESSRQAPAQRPTDPYQTPDYDSYAPIDIERIVEEKTAKAVLGVFNQKEKEQRDIQNRMISMANSINADPDYALVKDLWEGKLQDPTFSNNLRTGQLHPEKAYMETKIEALKNVAKLAHQTLTTLNGTPQVADQPVLETSGSRGQAQNLVGGGNDTPAKYKEQADLQAKINKGYNPSDDEILDTFDDVLDTVFTPG